MLTGMIMLKGSPAVNAERFSKDYAMYSDAAIDELVKDGSTVIFNIEGATVAISSMPHPIAAGDIQAAAKRAYNWPAALTDTKAHKSHLVIAVSENTPDPLKHYIILTEVISSLLRTTEAIGIYMAGQSLLIAAADYLNEAEDMGEEYLPLNLWLYFGVQTGEKGVSGYTYGLKDFNRMELEIIDSKAAPDEVRAFLFNIAHYILDNEVTFESGDTCGVTDDEAVVIECTAGRFVKGTSCKLLYRQ